MDIPSKKVAIDNGFIVTVKSYAPIRAKIDIIDAIKQECLNEIIIDQPKMDALFHMFVILAYTDIEVENRENDTLLDKYDELEVKGYLTKILSIIPKEEYDALISYLEDTIDDFNKYKVSIAGTMEGLVFNLPTLMESINGLLEGMDIEKLKNLAKIYSSTEH